MKLYRLYFTLIIALVMFAGCSSKHPVENLFDDYNNALQRFAGIKTGSLSSSLTQLISYPERRYIRIPIDEQRIDLSDFLTFKKCNLQELIAIRNNAMGKVMLPSQQLLYEVEFISRTKKCLTNLEDKELKQQLKTILVAKLANLNKFFWNATFGSKEFENLFSVSASAYKINYDKSSIAQTIVSLNVVIKILEEIKQENYSVSEESFENSLRLIAAGKVGGKLLQTIRLVIENLVITNSLLQQIIDNVSRESIVYEPEQRKLLKDLFYENYVQRLQSYISLLSSDLDRFQLTINDLYFFFEINHGNQFSLFLNQYNNNDQKSLTNRFKTVINDHTNYWRKLDQNLDLDLTRK